MEETFEMAGRHLVEACLADLAIYKRSVKTLDSQAVRRLVESIIAQKIDQIGDLKTITGNPGVSHSADNPNDGGTDGMITEIWPGLEPLLKAIITRENSFAEATRALANQTGSEEHRNALCACAERSRKFASWSQDHLDLLSLF